jgi:hypothetical protein
VREKLRKIHFSLKPDIMQSGSRYGGRPIKTALQAIPLMDEDSFAENPLIRNMYSAGPTKQKII